jgi:hypothetical protein
MAEKNLMRLMIAALVALLTGVVPAVWAQTKPAAADKPANNLEIIHEKLKADKKLIVDEVWFSYPFHRRSGPCAFL